MNTKIILSLVVIFAVATIAVGGTVAYFSDTETSTGNTFTAGTLDLNVDNGNINVVKFTVTDANPGATGGGTWKVNNVGSIAGYLDLEAISQTNNDNDCTEPETAAPDTTCGAGEGELGANMDVVLFVDTDNSGTLNGAETPIYSGKLSGIAANYDLNLALATGGTNYITMTWSIDSGVGNIIQSDSTVMNLSFELGQTTGQ